MKTGEITTKAGCKVTIERAGAEGVGITIVQADGKRSDTFACRTSDLEALIPIFQKAIAEKA